MCMYIYVCVSFKCSTLHIGTIFNSKDVCMCMYECMYVYVSVGCQGAVGPAGGSPGEREQQLPRGQCPGREDAAPAGDILHSRRAAR